MTVDMGVEMVMGVTDGCGTGSSGVMLGEGLFRRDPVTQ